MTDVMTATLSGLSAGAAAFTGRDAAARAALARETALAVAGVAHAWVDAAVTIKRGDTIPALRPTVVAEETATGPLATLRLLLVTVRAADEIARFGTPRAASMPRVLHQAGAGTSSFIGIDMLPALGLVDRAMFGDYQATVRCVNPGDVAGFARSWREEARDRPCRGGVAVVLGAGNVTGLSIADSISQIFEHGRAVLLKLHPLHAPLEPIFRTALAPLLSAGLVEIVTGGADVAAAAIASPATTHVHLTGGQAAFDAIVWGGSRRPPHAVPVLAKPISCELGGVTPWLVIPGRYSPAELASQADLIAATIVNNTSFNCIATKCVITCRSWDQRDDFIALVARRLESQPPRLAWYPGAAATWEAVTGRTRPADGTLPWTFRAGIDPVREPHWLEREWFVPVAVEVPLDATDIEAFCSRSMALTRRLPGSLAASVTMPASLPPHDRQRADLLVEHLEYGTVAVNTWSALAYTWANTPWGGFPGATLDEPKSGIGWVHDPLLLPLVHNTILRSPLVVRPTPPWFPWHRRGEQLARGVIDVYTGIARGGSGLWPLMKMLPAVARGS